MECMFHLTKITRCDIDCMRTSLDVDMRSVELTAAGDNKVKATSSVANGLSFCAIRDQLAEMKVMHVAGYILHWV